MKKLNIDIHPMRDITALGSIILYGFLLLFVLSIGRNTLFIDLLLGFIITLGIPVLVRSVYFRERPNKQTYSTFIERLDASSFPSIHASRIAFLAVYFSVLFASLWAAVFFSVVALLVLFSRVTLKKHDWLDLSVGVIVGVFSYYLVTLLSHYFYIF